MIFLCELCKQPLYYNTYLHVACINRAGQTDVLNPYFSQHKVSVSFTYSLFSYSVFSVVCVFFTELQ